MLEFMGKKPIRKNLTIGPILLSKEQNQQLEKVISSQKGNSTNVRSKIPR